MGYFLNILFVLIFFGTSSHQVEQFICDNIGRIENPSDGSCNSYYVCSITPQGELMQTEYTCPEGSIFSPEMECCSDKHICSRASESHHDEIEIEKSDNIHYQCQEDESFQFECTMSGRYADLQGSNCSKYHTCSLLKNGSYMRSEFECPHGTNFDPSTQKCDEHYECPCTHSDGSFLKFRRSISEELLHQIITTPLPTIFCEPSEVEFTCDVRGRFPDRRDMSCSTYYHCELDEKENLMKKHYRCPKCLSFDPSLGKCTNKFICPCSSTEAPDTTTNTTQTTIDEFSRTDINSSGHSITERYMTSAGYSSTNTGFTGFTDNIIVSTTQNDYETTSVETRMTTNSEVLIECDNFASDTPYLCTSRGRFVDRSDLSCSSYFLCSALRNGTLVQTSYRCPLNSWFDPSLGRCSTLYVCPCSSTTARNRSESTTPISTFGTSSQTSEREIDPYSVGTTTTPQYTEAITQSTQGEEEASSIRTTTGSEMTGKSSSGSSQANEETTTSVIEETTTTSATQGETSSIGTTKKAETNSGFTQKEEETSSVVTSTTAGITDKVTSGSNSANEETSSIETTSTTEAVNECDYSASDTPYICTSRGRFVDRSDLSCSSYFLCSALRNGTLVQTSYRCPLNSWFDPSLGRCSTLYVCPCSSTTARNRSDSTTPISTFETSSQTSGREINTYSTTDIYTSSTSEKFTESSERTERTSSSSPQENEETSSVGTTTTPQNTEVITQTTQREEEESSIRTTTGDEITEKSSSGSSQANEETTTSIIEETTTTSATQGETSSIGTTKKAETNSGFTQKEEETSSVVTSTTAGITDKVTSGSNSANEETSSIETTSTTEAVNECDYSASDTPYICTSRGRFVDRSDLSCSSYFLCSALRNGTLVQTSYRCPLNSWFDPSLGRCSTLYVCPCSSTTARNRSDSTTPISTFETSSQTSEREINTYSTTDIYTSSTSEKFTESSERTERTSSSSPQENEETISVGTTTTPQNTEVITQTTQREEEESSIRTTTGDEITEKSSSGSSQANEETTTSIIEETTTTSATQGETSSIGTTRTAATSSGFTQKEEETSSVVTSTTAGITDKVTSGSTSANEETRSTETTSTTEAGNGCDYSASDTPYICTSRGRFADRSDLSCSSYFLCSALRNGTLVQTSYRCPLNSWFDPSLGRCSTLYVCPCSSTTARNRSDSTTPISTFETSSQTSEREINTYSTTDIHTSSTSEKFTESSERTERTSSSSPQENEEISSVGTTTTPQNTEVITQTTQREEEASSIRTTTGDEITEKSSSGSSQANEETTTSIIEETTTTSATQKETSSIGTTRTAATSSGFTQKEEESTSVVTSTTAGITDKVTSGSTSANEETRSTETTSTTEAGNECDYSASDTPYICTSRGRFVDRSDLSCSSYFLCSALRNGTLVQTSYRCPLNSWFDPSLGRCSTLYVCPCSSTTARNRSDSTTPISTFETSSQTSEREINTYSTTDIHTSSTSEKLTESSERTERTSSSSPQENEETSSVGTTTTPQNTEVITQTSQREEEASSIRTTTGDEITEKSSSGSSQANEETTTSIIEETSTTSATQKETSSIGTTRTAATSSGFTQKEEESTSVVTSTTAGITDKVTSGSTPANEETRSTETTSTTEAGNECDYSASDTPYICTSRGRFVDRSDLSCSSYFLCSALRNGTLVQTSYRCPLNSWFDPSLGRCSTLYVCPCSSTTARNRSDSTTPISTFETSSQTSEREMNTYSTTDIYTSSTSEKFTESSESTERTSSSSPQENEETSSVGTTTTPQNTEVITQTTQREEEASSIRTTTGSEMTEKSSSGSSQANEETTTSVIEETTTTSATQGETSSIGTTKKAETNSGFTQKEAETSSVVTSTTAGITDKVTSGSTSANEETSSKETTSTTEAVNECDYSGSDTPYICTSRGRFVDRSDLSCSSYFLCSTLRNGTLVQTSYRCPLNSWFDPSLGRCSTLYVCPCASTTARNRSDSTTPISTFETSPQTSEREMDPYSVGTTTTPQYTEAITQSTQREEEASSIRTTTGGEMTEKSSSGSSQASEETTTSVIEETTTTSATQGETSSIGTTKTAETNSGFTQKEEETSSVVTSTTAGITDKVTSGSTSAIEETSSIGTTSTTEAGNECDYSASDTPYICSSRGRFVDRSDLSCSSYFLCSALRNGTLVQTSYRCPLNSWFDPSLGRCSTLYVCPCSITTARNRSDSTTPISTFETSSQTSEREIDPYSVGTTTTPQYTEAITQSTQREEEASSIRTTTGGEMTEKSSSGSSQANEETRTSIIEETSTTSATQGETSSIGTTKTAETNSGFTQKEEETSSVVTSTTAGITDKVTSGSTSANEETSSIETTSTTEAVNECDYSASDTPYICTSRGRFVDRSDLSCSSYFLCSALRNGTLVQTSYRCPLNSWFDPSLGRCSTLYVCPCSITTARNRSDSTTPISTFETSSKTSEREIDPYSVGTTTTPQYTEAITQSTQREEEASSIRTTTGGEMTEKSSSGSSQASEETTTSVIEETTTTSATQGETSSIGTTKTAETNSGFTQKEEETSSVVTSTTAGITDKVTSGSTSANEETSSIETTSTTEAVNECDYSASDTPYICTSRGRFVDRSDLSCSSYFLCSALRNGTLVQTSYRCPLNSWFDPSLGRCSTLYVCPCSITTARNRSDSTTPISTFETTSKTSEREIDPYSVGTTTTPQYTEAITQSTQREEEASSIRTTTGGEMTEKSSSGSSQANEETTTSVIEETTTTFATQGETSSIGTTKTAETNSGFTQKEEETSSVVTSTTAGITDKVTSGSTSAIEETSSIGTTSTTEAGNECDYSASDTPYICTSRGRFVDRSDLSCSSYFLCSALRNGTLVQTSYRCPLNSWFDPSLGRCSTLYVCPCSSTTARNVSDSTTSIVSVDTSSQASEEDTSIFSTTDTNNVSTRGNGETSSVELTSITSSTELSSFGPIITTEGFDECDSSAPRVPFICTTKGRFADRGDLTCSSYYHCSILADGRTVQTQYRCLDGFKFDPHIQQCSSEYKCPCEPVVTQRSTSNSPSTTGFCDPSNEFEFVCTTDGRFRNPRDLSCCTYYSCGVSQNNSLIQTEFTCPEGSKFDPDLGKCSIEYKCPCSVTEAPREYTVPPVDCTIPTEDFVCSSSGRFPDRQDVSCCNYILCSRARNGSFIKNTFSCPLGSTFNPDQQRCSYHYECPCIRTEKSITDRVPRTIAAMASTHGTSTANGNEVIKENIPSVFRDCVPLESSSSDFHCTVVGRFLNPQDSKCSSYVDCVADGTNIVKSITFCDGNTRFDYTLQKCTPNAICKICTERI